MRKEILSKTLVLGVILLFFSVGVQPAFAIVEPEEEIEPIRDSPIIEFTYEILGYRWIAIWVTAWDDTSGIDRLEIYFDGELEKIFYGGFTVEKILEFTYPPVPYTIVKAVAYDRAGNRAEESINLREMFDFNIHSGDISSNLKLYNAEDCDCKEVDSLNLIRANLMLTKLKVLTNILLLKFGHISEVGEICYEMSDIINSNFIIRNPNFCNKLENLVSRLDSRYSNLEGIQSKYKEMRPYLGGFLAVFLEVIQAHIYLFHQLLSIIGYQLCDWPYPEW